MTFTTLLSPRGQLTLPAKLRKKYTITPDTPLRIIDKEDGTLEIQICTAIPYGTAIYQETDKEISISFPAGEDPQHILEELRTFHE